MRKVIYKTLGIVVEKDGKPNRLYENVSRETSLYIVLESLISESKSEKAEIFCSFCGLKYQALSIVNYLYISGYGMLEDANKKDLRVNTYRLRYTGENCYFIQIKTGYKSFVTLQNIEAVIGLKKMPETVEELKKATDLYDYTRDTFLSGLKNADTRLLYGGSSISRTMFNRCNEGYCMSVAGFKRGYIHKKQTSQVLEEYCRPAVHGGFNYLSEKGRTYTGKGIVLDVNSLYPYIASHAYLPYPHIVSCGNGAPEKRYIKRKGFYYTIMKVIVSATLKRDGIPCILKDGSDYNGSNYLTKMEKRLLTLTESDRRLLFDNYDITYYSIQSHITFKADKKTFRGYIEPLYEKKRTLQSGVERDFVKSMLNGFIGTFARKAYTDKYIFTEKDGHMVAEKTGKEGEELYKAYKRLDGMCFVNAAIVSASREYIVHYIKKHMDRFLYTDTDSIHLSGTDIPSDIPVSDKMGAFKVEHTFTKCMYRGIKKYMIIEDDKIIPTIAGIPKDSFEKIGKCEGVNIKKIKKYVDKKNLYKLFNSNIGVSQLVEDIDTGTCEYECHGISLINDEKIKGRIAHINGEYRRRREGYDYYTGKEISKNLYQTYGEEKKTDHIIDKWNYNVDAGKITPSFDLACEYLKREIHTKRGDIWSDGEYSKGWWTIE